MNEKLKQSNIIIDSIKISYYNSNSNHFLESNMFDNIQLQRNVLNNEREKLLIIMKDKYNIDVDNILSNINTKRKCPNKISLIKQMLIENIEKGSV